MLPPVLYAIEDPESFPGVVLDGAGDARAAVPVDLTLLATGAPHRETDVYRYLDDAGAWVTNRQVFTTRAAQLEGSLGAIGVGDESDDATDGTLHRQESTIG